MKKLNIAENGMFVITELLFCLAFLSACEIPNWTRGPYSPNQCMDRWMFAAALFVPSGLEVVGGSTATTRTSRRKVESPPEQNHS
jgi:hypothetical protein